MLTHRLLIRSLYEILLPDKCFPFFLSQLLFRFLPLSPVHTYIDSILSSDISHESPSYPGIVPMKRKSCKPSPTAIPPFSSFSHTLLFKYRNMQRSHLCQQICFLSIELFFRQDSCLFQFCQFLQLRRNIICYRFRTAFTLLDAIQNIVSA